MGLVVNAMPLSLYSRKRPGTHCTGSWVGPRAGLHANGKPTPTGIGCPDRSARSYTDCGVPTPRCYAEHIRINYIHMQICKWTTCTVDCHMKRTVAIK